MGDGRQFFPFSPIRISNGIVLSIEASVAHHTNYTNCKSILMQSSSYPTNLSITGVKDNETVLVNMDTFMTMGQWKQSQEK